MLREGVEIMKAMWTEEVVDYEGEHYTLKGAICQPKPVQDPHIPIWVAGGGEQVTLRIAARHAQYTNFGGGDLDLFQAKSQTLRSHCDEVGTDFDSITRSANFNVLCAETEAGVADKLRRLEDHLKKYVADHRAERQVDLYRGSAGTPKQIVSWLRDFEAAGMTYAIMHIADAAYDRESLELVAKEVIPAFS
jgi:alkanesulfonate monooxygenase SsuD/methylene tetrahydromethanopterin reductase-like flavin-dependent oxidoreductase (luciferase family)